MTDYSLWEVILNGDSPFPTRVIEGVVQPVAPTTAEQRLARKNELKARGTLLMALPNKHQLKFNIHKDAKTLMEAIEKRFGGNKETKKGSLMSNRVLLLQSRAMKRHKLFQLAYDVHTYGMIPRTDESVSAVASVSAASATILVSALPNVDTLSNAVIYSLFASQSNSLQLDNDDLKQIDVDDLEEMDLKWQMAMLTMQARRFLQRTGRNLGSNRTTLMGFDMSNVECYNCHRRGHFARECRSLRTLEGMSPLRLKGGMQRRNQPTMHSWYTPPQVLSVLIMRDKALVALRKNFENAKQERDELRLKLEKFQTSSKNLNQLLASQTNDKTRLGYNNQIFTSYMFDCDEMFSSETNESLPASLIYDRGTFMPPKPNLVFHNGPNVYETVHTAFNVELSPTKPDKDLSPTHRPSAPIIKDWVSDSDDGFEAEISHNVPSFVQPTEQVKSPRPFVKPVETYIIAVTHKTAIPKPKTHRNSKNRKVCFVCKSLTHLIKDCDYYDKKMVQKPARNHAQKGNHQHYARMTLPNSQRHVVSIAVLTKSRLVPLTTARPVTAAVLKTQVTRPRPMQTVFNQSHSPPRRNINRRPSPNPSNFLHKFTTAKVSQGNPQHALKDKGVIDSGCSRHMTGSMSYLSDFKAINEGYVAFGGNQKVELKLDLFSVSNMCDKKNNVLFTDTECIVLSPEFKLPDKNQVLLRVPKENNKSDNGTEFKNHDLNQFCGTKGIKREFSVARTPQQNGIAERKNKTLIKAARTMLADSLLPIPFWAEAVNTACYVQNRVLVTKPHNKTPYELLYGRTPSIGFMRPFGCLVTILNTLYSLRKFDGKVDEGFLVGYSVSSKAFRVFNSRTRIVQETLHINFLENKPNVAGSGPTWLFDIDTLRKSMNYQPVSAGNQPNPSAGVQDYFNAEKAREENVQQYVLFPSWPSVVPRQRNMMTRLGERLRERILSNCPQEREAKGKNPVELSTRVRKLIEEFEDFTDNSTNEVSATSTQVPDVGKNSTNSTNTFSAAGPSNTAVSPTHRESSYVDPSQYPDDPDMPALEDITYSDDEEDVGAEADFTNLETTITSMTRMVSDEGGLTQINTDDLHTCMFACFLSQEEPKKVHKALKETSWIEAIQEEILQIEAIRLFLAYASFMGFMVYQMDVKSAFLYGTIEEEVYVYQPPGFKDLDYLDKVYKVVKALSGLHQAPRAWQKSDILLVQIYVDDIIFGSTNKDLCKAFEKLMKDKFQMSSIGELTFFLASTPIDTKKPLLKDSNGEDVDVHTYRLISWQCKKQTVVSTSSTEAEKKVLINKETVREALHLDDAESIDCLPNEEIFTELARMGYEKPSTKLTFYKAFFSSQWKFLIHTILQCMSAKRTTWNKFSLFMASAVICLSTGKGFSGIETPSFEGMIVAQQVDDVADEGAASVNIDDVPAVDSEPTIPSPPPTTQQPPPSQEQEQPSTLQIAQALEITKLKQRVKKLEMRNKLKVSKLRRLKKVGTAQRVETSDDTVMDDVSKQGEIIANMDADEDVTLKDVAAVEKDSEVKKDAEPAELKEVVEVVTTAKLMTEVVTTAVATSTAIVTAAPTITTAPSTARIMVHDPKPLKKQAQIEQDEAYARELEAELNKNINWDDAIEHAQKNMMIYLKNMDGFKLDYFKGMNYDTIRLIFKKYFNSNVAFLEKSKEQLEEEESRALKRKAESLEEKAKTG
nr:retrovirus-related Pol polyprotein from transposon TNT 1-94 [Tanacetum cinerariifolium]